jgi:uncharacterized protein (TIGR00661 family)
MRILYGVVGEGMGHATRSRVVLEHLLASDHQIKVVVSGRAHDFLKRVFDVRPGISIEEIEGLTLAYEDNRLEVGESLLMNLQHAPEALRKNVEAYTRIIGDAFDPQAVVSDFESWAYFYARVRDLPVISIDNMQVINRCAHEADITDQGSTDFFLAKTAVKIKLPGAYHYLITSFFFPPVRKPRTTLVPPILRPEILAAKREPGDHVLVYQTSSSNTALPQLLKRFPFSFRVYGMDRTGEDGNLSFRAFSQTGFVDDLRSARAVIAGGGFSLMTESVHLAVPMLSVPIEGQYEQEINARYLTKLGYGAWARKLEPGVLESFLQNIPRHQEALRAYPRQDNQLMFNCLDELLTDVGHHSNRPDRLQTKGMGSYQNS